MIKQLVNFILEQRTNLSTSRKRLKFKRNIILPIGNSDFDKNYRNRWTRLYSKFDHKYPYYCASINSFSSINYVPENIYYNRIEPVLNNRLFALAYADKNFYENYLKDYAKLFPETMIRGINGRLYSFEYKLIQNIFELGEFLQNGTEYILKPAVETSGGDRVVLVNYSNNEFTIGSKNLSCEGFVQYLHNEYKTNFVLQKKIFANKWFSDFNVSSLNTVRLYTYRSVLDEKIHPLQAVVRFGKPGNIVDNQAAGGLTCGINAQSKLNTFTIDKYGKKYSSFEFLSTKKDDLIPGLEEMKNYACLLASGYYYHRLLGFDFCYDKENCVRLLEINCKNIEINFLQMNNGPLFGDFTKEIIEFCNSHKKSVVLDFHI